MTRVDMAPGIDEFEAWLDNGGTNVPDPNNPLEPIKWREVHFANERWLNLTCEWYRDYRLQQTGEVLDASTSQSILSSDFQIPADAQQ